MQQVTTFDIAFENGIVIDGKMQGITGKLKGQVLGIWDRVQDALSTPVERSLTPRTRTLPGYYGGACERTSAAMPVVSFRGLA